MCCPSQSALTLWVSDSCWNQIDKTNPEQAQYLECRATGCGTKASFQENRAASNHCTITSISITSPLLLPSLKHFPFPSKEEGRDWNCCHREGEKISVKFKPWGICSRLLGNNVSWYVIHDSPKAWPTSDTEIIHLGEVREAEGENHF